MEPNWSPHGHRIAFWGFRKEAAQRDIWTVPAEGGEAVPVTEDPALIGVPSGHRTASISTSSAIEAAQETCGEWPSMRNQERSFRRPQPVNLPVQRAADDLAFPGRQTIAYTALDRRKNLQKIGFDPQDGKIARRANCDHQWQQNISSSRCLPRWRMAGFRLLGGYEHEDIFVIRTDGTDRRRLTSDSSLIGQPGWSPDGDTIAFNSTRSGRGEIWTHQSRR